ncbi:MAG: hypothetical protein M3353_02540 [Actinomycetota bacterium]|nr:hypothetical protein [Actinomycetota bacterium]
MQAQRARRPVLVCLVAVVVALVAGCTGSTAPQERGIPVPTEAGTAPGQGDGAPATGQLVVTGRLLAADGTPLAARPMLLSRELLLRDVVADGLLAVGSGFITLLSCFDSEGSVINVCRPGTFTATTDAGGGFALRLSADERLSALGGERDFAVDAAVPGGGGVRAVFPVDSALVDVPDLSVWDAAAAVSADSAAQRVTWAALPAPVASQIEYAVTFTDADRGLQLTRTSSGVEAAVDARLLEDSTGVLELAAQGTSTPAPAVALSWAAAPFAYAGSAGAPPSRGAGCTVSVETLSDAGAAGCWLTDGTFDDSFPGERPRRCVAEADSALRRCATAAVTRTVVDLETVQDVGLVVLRGGCDGCRVEVSEDGVAWRQVDADVAGLGGERLLRPAPGTRARLVRLSVGSRSVPRPEELELPPINPLEPGLPPALPTVPSLPTPLEPVPLPQPVVPGPPALVFPRAVPALPSTGLPETYGGDLSGVTEVSVWPPTAAERAAQADTSFAGADDGSPPLGLVVLATALLSTAGTAVALAGRRARRPAAAAAPA